MAADLGTASFGRYMLYISNTKLACKFPSEVNLPNAKYQIKVTAPLKRFLETHVSIDWNREKRNIFFSYLETEPQALLEVHCLDAARECVNVLYMTGPNRKPRQRSQPRPDSRRSGPDPWWRLASGTVCLLSELYILRIMSERSQHKGEVNNASRRTAG